MARNQNWYITFGQVSEITATHVVSNPEVFPEYIGDQIEENRRLQNNPNFNSSTQSNLSKEKILEVVHESTDYDSVMEEYKRIKADPSKTKKINTVPGILVHLFENNPEGSIIPEQVFCSPLSDTLLDVPKRGQWVTVLVCTESVLNENNSFSRKTYFYLPFSLRKRKFAALKDVNEPKDVTSGKVDSKTAKNILWPRSGSSIVQNQNGKAHLLVDSESVLLSTGFSDMPQGLRGDEIEKMYIHEFFRLNPPDTSDSFIFVDKYDRDFEARLNEYRKKLYELEQFDDTTIVDEIITSLSNVGSFKDRMRVFFGIDFSDVYEWKYAPTPSQDNRDKAKGSGTLIVGEEIFLTNNTTDKRKDFSVARSEPTRDLIHGLIDLISELITALKTHKHLGTPASVLNPTPDFGVTIDQISEKLNKIQGELSEISSSKIHIP